MNAGEKQQHKPEQIQKQAVGEDGEDTVDIQSDPSTEIASDLSDCEGSDGMSVDSDEEDADEAKFAVADTLLIFDWDDTVLPTTWIGAQGLGLAEESVPTKEQMAQLEKVAQHASATLTAAKRYGTLVIITNAERGWIELTCQKFMPSLYPALEGVRLLSARSTYEPQGIASPFEWKYLAFEEEIRCLIDDAGDRMRNVMSFGDSAHEREALIRATEQMPSCRTKSLKFAERPEIDQLLKQHALISGCFDHIVNHDGNLDLCIRCG